MITHPQLMAMSYGNEVVTTAAGTTQVGIHRIELDLPLKVPDHAFQFIVTSPFDVDGTEGWLGLIYVPKGTLMIAPFNLAMEPEAVALTFMQEDHSLAAVWEQVFANAT